MKIKRLWITLLVACFAMIPLGGQVFAANTFDGEAPISVSDSITEKSSQQVQPVSSNIVIPSSVSTKTMRKAQTFRHLRVFSFGGLMVLFFFFAALTFGPVWTFVFAILLSHWGWFTLPDSLGWLQSGQAFHVAIFLGVIAFIFSFIPNFGLPGALDVALVLGIVWIVMNGVFVDTGFLGRLFLTFIIVFGSVIGNAALEQSSVIPLSQLALPAGTFCCMTMISIWL